MKQVKWLDWAMSFFVELRVNRSSGELCFAFFVVKLLVARGLSGESRPDTLIECSQQDLIAE